jgi:hypothetical protein
MAKAVIKDIEPGYVRKISTASLGNAKISYSSGRVKINDILPFRVKFTTIGIQAYGPNNPAPIGLAVIGLNNYIL